MDIIGTLLLGLVGLLLADGIVNIIKRSFIAIFGESGKTLADLALLLLAAAVVVAYCSL